MAEVTKLPTATLDELSAGAIFVAVPSSGFDLPRKIPANQVGSRSFLYTQTQASNVWVVDHGLNKYPTVAVMDTDGNLVLASVVYTSLTQVVVTFSESLSGKVACS